MPDGRFLSKSIAYSAQVASVSFEADYLFTRMIPFLDRDGRVRGEPLAIKGMCVPLRENITPEVIARCLAELASAKLIVWYQVEEKQCVEMPGFEDHQRGARLDREAESKLPSSKDKKAELLGIEAAHVRTTPDNSGPSKSDKRRVSKEKGSEVKRRKVKRREEAPDANAAAAGSDQAAREKPPAKKRETWVTPFADAWHEMYGGPMSVEPSVRPLKDAVNALGSDEALRRWEIYLSQTPGRFANAAKFAATLNEWEAPKAGGKAPTPRVTVSDITMARAATLFAVGRDFKLLAFAGNKAEYTAAKLRAQQDPRAGETFDDDLKASRIWEGLERLDAAMAIKEIGRRLELSRQNGQHAEPPVRAAS